MSKLRQPPWMVVLFVLSPNERYVYDARRNLIRVQHLHKSRWHWCWVCDVHAMEGK